MSLKQLDPEFERMMKNWALWQAGSSVGSSSVNSIYLMAPPSRVRFGGTVVPILALEAAKVDAAIGKLDIKNHKLAAAVCAYWTSSLGHEYLAVRCKCRSVQTFYNRLKRAHDHLGVALHRRVYPSEWKVRHSLQTELVTT